MNNNNLDKGNEYSNILFKLLNSRNKILEAEEKALSEKLSLISTSSTQVLQKVSAALYSEAEMSDACSKQVQDIELASDPSLNNLEKKISELNQCLNRVERKEYLYQINECYKFIINQFCLVSNIKLSYFYKSIKNEQQQTLNDFKPKKYFNRGDYSNENIFNTIKVKPMHKLFLAFLNSRSLTDQNFISIQLYIDYRHESLYDLTPKDFKDQLDKYGEFIDYFKTDDGFFVSTYKAIISVTKKLVDEILALEDSVTNHITSNLKD